MVKPSHPEDRSLAVGLRVLSLIGPSACLSSGDQLLEMETEDSSEPEYVIVLKFCSTVM